MSCCSAHGYYAHPSLPPRTLKMSFSYPPRAQALSDLIGRYWSIFGAAWRSRQELAGPERASYEIAFLPANLELIESPVHPAPRWTMLSLVVLGFLVICIALFGRLDIVATAKGKLLPDARVKVVQPAVTGIVRRITVIDGQRVVAGQVLDGIGSRHRLAPMSTKQLRPNTTWRSPWRVPMRC